jgi:hypothetical protein
VVVERLGESVGFVFEHRHVLLLVIDGFRLGKSTGFSGGSGEPLPAAVRIRSVSGTGAALTFRSRC